MGNLIVELDNRNHGGYMKLKKKKTSVECLRFDGYLG